MLTTGCSFKEKAMLFFRLIVLKSGMLIQASKQTKRKRLKRICLPVFQVLSRLMLKKEKGESVVKHILYVERSRSGGSCHKFGKV